MALPVDPPNVFISYAWEEEPHPTWVKQLATRLRTMDGLDVTLDRWVAQPGDELTLFMEKNVRESRFVLLICTPTYKAKFDERLGGVGYEATSITGQILSGIAKRKFIPIHRSGTWTEAAPTIVEGGFHINLTGDPYKEAAYRALVDTLHGRREVAPAVGHGDTLFEGPGAAPAIPIADFSGRDQELQSLLAHLRAPDQKAVCVVASGIGGVGKTALARQLVATEAASLFPEGAAWLDGTHLVSELARVSRRFGWPEPTEPTPQQATEFLKNQLHERTLLLVVDNLPANGPFTHVPIPGGKCRTLVTSRLVNLAQDLGVPAATIHLEHWSLDSCRRYLRDVVPRLAKEPDAELDALSGFVQGLPLAIRLIVRALLKNVSRSTKEHLARLKAEPLGTLDKFATDHDRGIAATFLEAYGSLSPDTQGLLRALAACAQGTRTEIVAAVAGRDTSTAEDALNALGSLSLAEFREGAAATWGLHDVVRMFVRAQPESGDAEVAHLAWVREHQRRHSDPLAHAELEKGTAEGIAAFERRLAAADHRQADTVLFPIFKHLTRYGRYAQAIDLCERMLASLKTEDEKIAAVWLGNLGVCYQTLGHIPKAIDFLQRSLAKDEKLGRLEGQANQLGNLGLCYQTLGDIPKTIDFFLRSLEIFEKLGRLEGQAGQLGNLGLCYQTLGHIPKAIDFFLHSLEIFEKLGRLEGQANLLGNLGACYLTLDDILKAIDFLQRSLEIFEKLGGLEGQASQLGNLGLCHRTLGNIPKAIDFHQRSLESFKKLGGLEGQASQLGNLGLCHWALRDIPKAIDFLQRSLAMNVTLGSLEGQANQLGNLGLCYQMRGDIPKAIDFHQRSLALFQKMGLPEGHPTVVMQHRALAAMRANQ